jgi:hypothetical protein
VITSTTFSPEHSRSVSGATQVSNYEVFCFFASGAVSHDCSQKKAFFFFEKKEAKNFHEL